MHRSPIALKHVPIKAIALITNVMNKITALTHIPTQWKKTTIIPIKKPNKNKNDITSYRPICLLPTLSKIYEKCIARKITETCEHKLIKEQYGFRQGHSCVDQLMRIVDNIQQNRNTGHKTGMVTIDLEKAFDKVDHSLLIHKMMKIEIPPRYTEIIKSYLKNRKFRVKVGDEKSAKQEILGGVPQGSALGPLLFTIFINDTPIATNKNHKTALFADDIGIIVKNRRDTILQKELQAHTDTVISHLERWGMKINASKCESIMFDKINRDKDLQKIHIKNKTIAWKQHIKYLEVVLDKKLNFREHISQSIKKIIPPFKSLYPVLKNNPHTAIAANIYKAYIRPILTYASPVWCCIKNYKIKQIARKQNKILRIIANQPFGTTNEVIRNMTSTPALENHLIKLNRAYWLRLKQHRNPTARAITTNINKTHQRIVTSALLLENLTLEVNN